MEISELIFSALEQISGGIRKDLEAGELSFCYRDFQNNFSCVAGKLLKYIEYHTESAVNVNSLKVLNELFYTFSQM